MVSASDEGQGWASGEGRVSAVGHPVQDHPVFHP